jgi:FkbM family methyltransferase
MNIKRIAYRMLPAALIGFAAAAMRPKASYALTGEDVIAERLLLELIGARKGTYVDIGAYHPVLASNTHRLYKAGWRGVNIEADAHKVQVFNALRGRDTNICAVVDAEEREAEFFDHAGAKYSSMAGLNIAHVAHTAHAMGREIASRKVRTRTLSSILDEAGVRRVDFLNIDVEGSEGAILRSVDLRKFGVALVACEIHGSTLDEVLESEACLYLITQGFTLCAWAPPTVFLQPRDLPRVRYGKQQNDRDRAW